MFPTEIKDVTTSYRIASQEHGHPWTAARRALRHSTTHPHACWELSVEIWHPLGASPHQSPFTSHPLTPDCPHYQ
jgi:hypothetical protein